MTRSSVNVDLLKSLAHEPTIRIITGTQIKEWILLFIILKDISENLKERSQSNDL
jgi:hypothetical protein